MIQAANEFRWSIGWSETMRTHLAIACMMPLISSAIAENSQEQVIAVGPWHIATTYHSEKFDNCTMARSAGGLGVTFVRTSDGLLLLLDSDKWKLDRGKVYSVRLVAGSQSVEAKALAESKSVTIALPERSFNENLRTSSILQVRGDGATLRIPLEKSMAALERLELCFEKNSRQGSDTNPFVAVRRTP
jgi:hypothetical protein